MANPNNASKEKALNKNEEINEPAEAGKKAIEADKKINKQDKSDEQKNEEEKKMLNSGVMKAEIASIQSTSYIEATCCFAEPNPSIPHSITSPGLR